MTRESFRATAYPRLHGRDAAVKSSDLPAPRRGASRFEEPPPVVINRTAGRAMARAPVKPRGARFLQRKAGVCVFIPLCLCCVPPADPQSPAKVAQRFGRDHTVGLCGAGLPVRAAAGRARRGLLGQGPFLWRHSS